MGRAEASTRVGVLGLVAIGFFWVHGGIYGNEALLSAAPPAYVFALLIAAPILYSLPIALIVAELATAWPADGGYVVWVQMACGKAVGAHHAFWVWVIYAADAAIYPVLLAAYVAEAVPLTAGGRGLVATGVVALVTAVNLRGVDAIVRLSAVLSVLSLLPAVAFVALGAPRVEPRVVLRHEGPVDWSLLLSWVLWLYCGFFSLGTLAGDLHSPRRTFLCALALLLPAVVALDTLPLLVALSIDPDQRNYAAGYYNDLARALAGDWLAAGFQGGAALCLVGLYNAASLTAERTLAWLLEQHPAVAALPKRLALPAAQPDAADRAEAGASDPSPPVREGAGRRLARWLVTNRHGAAPAYQLANAVVACALAWAPYGFLVEFSMLLSVPSVCLFMWSFARLRSLEGHVPRPFSVPGGPVVAVGITLVPIGVSLAYAGVVAKDAWDGRHSARSQVLDLAAVLVLGLAAHAAIAWRARRGASVSPRPAGTRGWRGKRAGPGVARAPSIVSEASTASVVSSLGGDRSTQPLL